MDNYASRFDWHKAVDSTVSNALGGCYPRDWKDEDHLTRTLLSALRNEHSSVTIDKDKIIGKKSKCHWDIYKNTKQKGMEPKHGDIGVLVQLHFDNGKVLEGVAFLEAKRIYHDPSDDSKSKFTALDTEQLERYCANSPFHRTVFYDCLKTKDGYTAVSVTLPTRHLLTIDKNDRDIYLYCEYLSYCLTNRYFQGYELDFDPDLVNSVKGFLGDNGGVEYLIVAQSTLKPELELNPELIEINRDIYKSIDTPEPDNTPTNNFGGPRM
ncbi:hypothetical protein [Cobetia marina]|uniref:hypothetical protein n=1 Tax=Cobetia marina TaxID=28258 RepID=UPI00174DDDB1